jgi:hypothetical protein
MATHVAAQAAETCSKDTPNIPAACKAPARLLLSHVMTHEMVLTAKGVRVDVLLQAETNNPKLRWAYLPYSMHMAGPREAIQHMIIRKNYGGWGTKYGRATCPLGSIPGHMINLLWSCWHIWQRGNRSQLLQLDGVCCGLQTGE